MYNNHILETIAYVSRHKDKIHDVINSMGTRADDETFYALTDEYFLWANMQNACRAAMLFDSEHEHDPHVQLAYAATWVLK